MKKNFRRFSLIELIVLSSVLSISFIIEVESCSHYNVKKKVLEVINTASEAKVAVSTYYLKHRSFPPNNFAAGLPSADRITSDLVTSVFVSLDGAIIISSTKKKLGISNSNQLQTIMLTPIVTNDSVKWACSTGRSKGIYTNYLPSECR